MTSPSSTLAARSAAPTLVTLSLRLTAALLAVAGVIKVSQTGAYGFALVLVLPWVLVAARSRPGPRAALTAVILGTLEVALAGSKFAAGGTVEWFDALVLITAFTLAPIAIALGGHLLLRPPQG